MTTDSDGRVARRQTNRDAVLDAVITQYREGDGEPTIEDVAKASGVSTRSIYRYFNHREELLRSALLLVSGRVEAEFALNDIGRGALDDRIDRFVAHRVRSHVELAPLTRALLRLPRAEDTIDPETAADPERAQLRAHFADEFDALDAAAHSRALAIADLPFRFLSLDYLYRICDRDADEVMVILDHLLTIHFAALAPR